MKLPLRFLTEAGIEFRDAAKWYEQRRPGLGKDFLERVGQALDRIASHPQMHPKVYGPVRKASVSRFPYIVLYQEEPTEILVISVFHTSRDPSVWQGRVSP